MKNQWDCVLNTDISFLLHLLLPSMLSIDCHTNKEFVKIDSEDDLLISRIQLLHHLLEVDYHDEEEWSVASTLDNRWWNNLVVQYRSKFFPQWVQFLWMSWQKYVFVVLLWPLIGLQKHVHSISTQNCRTVFLRFPARCRRAPCCWSPWSTYSIQEKFWPTSENCLLTDSNLFATPYLPCKELVVTSNTGPILVFPRIQPFGSHDFHLLAKCTHNKPLNLWIVRILQRHEVLSYFNCFQESCISTKFNHTILFWEPFHSFLYFCNSWSKLSRINRNEVGA